MRTSSRPPHKCLLFFVFICCAVTVLWSVRGVWGAAPVGGTIYRADAIPAVSGTNGYGSIIGVQNTKPSPRGLSTLRAKIDTPEFAPLQREDGPEEGPGVFRSEIKEDASELDSVLSYDVAWRPLMEEDAEDAEDAETGDYVLPEIEFSKEISPPFAPGIDDDTAMFPHHLNSVEETDADAGITDFPSVTKIPEGPVRIFLAPGVLSAEDSGNERDAAPLTLKKPEKTPAAQPIIPKTENTQAEVKKPAPRPQTTNRQKTLRARPLVTADPYAARPYYMPYVPTTGPGILVLPR